MVRLHPVNTSPFLDGVVILCRSGKNHFDELLRRVVSNGLGHGLKGDAVVKVYLSDGKVIFRRDAFSGILSEVRKYRLFLTVSHRYIEQLGEKLRHSVFGNAGTLVTSPSGSEDAAYLERQFCPEIKARDLIDHGKHHICLKLAIDRATTRSFSAITIPPSEDFSCQLSKGPILTRFGRFCSVRSHSTSPTGFESVREQHQEMLL